VTAPPGACASPPAGLTRRVVSVAYESLLLAAILFLVGFLLLPLVSPGRADAARALTVPDAPARAVLFCGLFAAAAVYFVWSWTGGRRTLPMQTWRMRLVDAGGAPPRCERAFARYCAAWIGPGLALATYVVMKPLGLAGVAVVPLGLNYLAALIDPERQFLHDRIAGTRIVQEG
jgi:uncharacterized RDD family membrane protein YckC